SVLYEMVTGRRAFAADSKMSTLSAILKEEPKPPEGVPPDLEKIIRRCLRKDPARRFQHMDDLKVALEEVREDSESGRLTPPASERKRKGRSEEHTSELQSPYDLVCRLLLEKKKKKSTT